MKYWVHDGQKAQGPYAVDELKELRGLRATTPVCPAEKSAQQKWLRAQDIPELKELFSEPPPLPSTSPGLQDGASGDEGRLGGGETQTPVGAVSGATDLAPQSSPAPEQPRSQKRGSGPLWVKALTCGLLLALGVVVLKKTPAVVKQGEMSANQEQASPQAMMAAAERGDARAQVALAKMYDKGRGVEKNAGEAMKWCRKAAEQGNADGQLGLGIMLAASGNTGESVEWLRKAAEQGNAEGQVLLGMAYFVGKVVEKNNGEAIKWTRMAAEQEGKVAMGAQGMLGMIYDESQDYGEAIKWTRKAAEQGVIVAQVRLGEMYRGGEGVEKNDDEALKWFRKAAEQGDAHTQVELGKMYHEGRYGVKKDNDEALKWTLKAAEQGNVEGQFGLGLMYMRREESREATKWFLKAAEQGDDRAKVVLEQMSKVVRAEPDARPAPRKVPAEKNAIQWVDIPGGAFSMGSDLGHSWEKPAHRVNVRGFRMAKTEVTVAQYGACVAAGACTAPDTERFCTWREPGKNDHPVNCLDWTQAKAFAEWAGGRLPSEAEWEYAARSAGKNRKHPWGDEDATCKRLVMHGCEFGTASVCSRPAGNTKQGLCDMLGNVSEWVQDWYHDSYNSAPNDGSAWETPGLYRVYRGSSWNNSESDSTAVRRSYLDPAVESRGPFLGVRPVRDVP